MERTRALMTLETIEYESFRKNLDYIIQDTDTLTKDTLKKLMRDKAFHETRLITFNRETKQEEKSYIRNEPTDKQLDIAWSYIQSKSNKTRDFTITRYRIEKYKRHTIKRSTGEVKWKEKIYKKGQFLPKNYED